MGGRISVPSGAGDLLFGNGQGNAEGATNIYKRFWLPLLVECGLATQVKTAGGGIEHQTRFSIHDLRHFHASLMIEAGMQARQLMEHMGHSSIGVTMDVYGHLFKDDVAKARRRALVFETEGLWRPAAGEALALESQELA